MTLLEKHKLYNLPAVFSVNAHESGALLKGHFPKTFDLFQLMTVLEMSMVFSPIYNSFGHLFANASNTS